MLEPNHKNLIEAVVMSEQTETSWIIELDLPQVNETIRVALGEPITVGRRHEHNVDVDLTPYGAEKSGVSRIHMAMHTDGANLMVTDLNSGNGTFLNTVRLESERHYTVKH